DLLHMAGRAPRRPCAVERAGVPGDGRAALDARSRVLPRRPGRARDRPGPVVLRRAAAPAQRGGADSRRALSAEIVPLAERAAAGHQLGALIVALVVLLLITGLTVGFLAGRQAL